MSSIPELLLPVGSLDMCLAAIHYGADAIYVGVPGFNARGRSKDFSIEELKEMIDLCHLYGVKVYLAFNVLIFEDELPQAELILRQVMPLGVDAFIVQDLGLVQMIKQMNPNQVVHGSTQMTITNDEAIHFLEDLDIKRFVLGRENSLKEIELIKNKTERELEVFVHGALCVAYSGQCFTSESLGGRSANRGQCAQSCRLSYDLVVDGEKKDLGDKKYLVSPQDLCGIEHVEELKRIGVHSFKVEGRLKGPSYVASTTLSYKKAIHGDLNLDESLSDMGQIYSRGFFSGWMEGVNHQRLVPATHSSHIGHEVGEILNVNSKSIKVSSSVKLEAGLGLSFLVDSNIIGAKIFKVLNAQNNIFEIELFNFDLTQLRKDLHVYINGNEKKKNDFEEGFRQDKKHKKIKLSFKVNAVIGGPLEIKVADDAHHEIEIKSTSPVEHSLKSNGVEVLKLELASMGGTPFKLDQFTLMGESQFYLPKSEIKSLRRLIVEKMIEARLKVPTVELHKMVISKTPVLAPPEMDLKLNVLLRSLDQVKTVVSIDDLKSKVNIIFLDFEFGKYYEEAITLIKNTGIKVYLATTRILKPNEYHNLNMLLRSDADGFLVRNIGAIKYLKERSSRPLWGDFSLNAANSLSANYFLDHGLSSLNLSYDLNAHQLKKLLENINPTRAEVTTYQYMPEFHMEHCVFAAFLSKGSSFRDCGKPCEKHNVELIDSYGNHHFLKADHECRNTMYRATSQSALGMISELKKLNVSSVRFEALNENGEELKLKINTLASYLNDSISLSELQSKLGSSEKYGLSSGQLFRNDSYADRKQE